jgi:L-histidine N-alpha-methyltransferase
MSDAALRELLLGLSARPRWVSSKYFYDERGSELFERITRLDEYYPTRTERSILTARMPDFVQQLRPRTLLELGAGNADKTRVILDAMAELADVTGTPAVYVPVDVSRAFLDRTATRLRTEYPTLVVRPFVADMTQAMDLPRDLDRPALFALLGSTIGNFAGSAAIDLLARVVSRMGPGDRFLMGADLRPGLQKSKALLERAYNDEAGVTAAFNRNLLRVLNARFDADFDPTRFDHLAYYDDVGGRVEMHLVAREPMTVSIGETRFRFSKGERVRTEISNKYDRTTVEELLRRSGMQLTNWWTDSEELFALAVAQAFP